MKTQLLAAVLALLGIPLLAACGGSVSAGSTPVKTNMVNLPPGYRFDPPVIEVPAGTSVTWTNHDNFSHSVQVQGGEAQVMKPGQSANIAFDKPGEYDYICTFHPQNMKGKVVVVER